MRRMMKTTTRCTHNRTRTQLRGCPACLPQPQHWQHFSLWTWQPGPWSDVLQHSSALPACPQGAKRQRQDPALQQQQEEGQEEEGLPSRLQRRNQQQRRQLLQQEREEEEKEEKRQRQRQQRMHPKPRKPSSRGQPLLDSQQQVREDSRAAGPHGVVLWQATRAARLSLKNEPHALAPHPGPCPGTPGSPLRRAMARLPPPPATMRAGSAPAQRRRHKWAAAGQGEQARCGVAAGGVR